MPVVLATTSSFATHCPQLVEALQSHGLELVCNPFGRKLTEPELRELLQRHCPVGLLAGTEPIGRDTLEACRDTLRVVSRVGVGWDNVDKEAAAALGIKVYRTEGVLTQAVAELTLGMILSALRQIPGHTRDICGGTWKKRMGGLLAGKTVGVVGFGAIGRRVAELVQAFGAKALFCDPVEPDACVCTACDLESIVSQADVITLHASGSCCILDAALLSRIKPGAILVNTARGGLIDEAALQEALASGRVAYACLDVFEKEPYTGPLAGLPNVVLTPHIGSYALEARILMEEAAVDNLLSGLAATSD